MFHSLLRPMWVIIYPLGASVLAGTLSGVYSDTICNSLSPPLIDIVRFGPLRIASASRFFNFLMGRSYHVLIKNANRLTSHDKTQFIFPYFFNKQSIMNVDGLPTTMGSLSHDPQTAATMQPAPKARN